jgi:hypothetical protein
MIRVRRYLCQACLRAVSLLPEFVLPYLRGSLTVIALFLSARLFRGKFAGQQITGLRALRRPAGSDPDGNLFTLENISTRPLHVSSLKASVRDR